MNKPVLALSLFFALSLALSAQTISNVRAVLEPSCGYYTISYDLSGKSGDEYQISLTPYSDTREITKPAYAKGQGIDAPVTAGKDLQIFWHPILEGAGSSNWQFRLSAKLSPWVFVEGGTFQMGSNDGDSDEKPVHQVTVTSFYIGKYEVTQKEWRDVMGSNPSNWKGDNLPVEKISWYDAVEYCNKLSLKEGLTPCYSGSGKGISCNWNANGYRLPTEAEWEFAARGGNQSKGYKYSGSNDIGTVAWYGSNSGDKTQAVGTKQANELGIHDMSGNVWEWCWDWYDSGYYAKSQSSDPIGAGSGSYRVLRGGSWGNGGIFCRVSDRSVNNPDFSISYDGVRVVRAIK